MIDVIKSIGDPNLPSAIIIKATIDDNVKYVAIINDGPKLINVDVFKTEEEADNFISK